LGAYLVITCAPNDVMVQLQDRMPLIVDVPDHDRCLSADPPPIDLLRPSPAERMTAYEISTKINKTSYDAPDILDPAPPARGEGPPRRNCHYNAPSSRCRSMARGDGDGPTLRSPCSSASPYAN
jgi:hypothetical protein